MTFLADTNIIGELTRPRPNPGVLSWAGQVLELSLSVITLEEIQYGLAWKPNQRVREWFDGFRTDPGHAKRRRLQGLRGDSPQSVLVIVFRRARARMCGASDYFRYFAKNAVVRAQASFAAASR